MKNTYTFTMMNGDKCTVIEPLIKHLWRATLLFTIRQKEIEREQETLKENFQFSEYEADLSGYVTCQLITINGEKPTFDQIGEMTFDDQSEMNSFLNIFLKNLNIT